MAQVSRVKSLSDECHWTYHHVFCVQEAAPPKCNNSTDPDPNWIPMSHPHSHESILEATWVEYKQFYTY